jgi:GTPase SAR1 family protein
MRKNTKGKNGLRIRKGLGTTDDTEADTLVEQMNQILSDETLWAPSARTRVESYIDERVISAFYDEIDGEIISDTWATRDKIIEIPSKDDGYTCVQLLGTTGAGKTTLIRQLIGSHPERDRFPSTSTSKTTISDIEIIMKDTDEYRAVVTFFPARTVRTYIEECVLAACKSYIRGDSENDIIRNLLEHSEQRFRLSYILGDLKILSQNKTNDDFIEDDEEEEIEISEENDSFINISHQERVDMALKLQGQIEAIKSLSDRVWKQMHEILGLKIDQVSKSEKDELEEMFEYELNNNDELYSIVDVLFDEVEDRFSLITNGNHYRTKQGWVEYWTFTTTDRDNFVANVRQMTSNYAPYYGRLLTPLVEGIRISGPFKPTWWDDSIPKLVLMDGEGIAHVSGESLSTKLSKRLKAVDAILLVDNGKQAMLDAPITVLRHLGTSGLASKLHICFTHFDEVRGDNLPDAYSKQNHLLASLNNALTHLANDLGGSIERNLRRNIEGKVFFVGGIHKQLKGGKQFTPEQLRKMLEKLQESIIPSAPLKTRPIYDASTLAIYILEATKKFHELWDAHLGYRYDPKNPKKHWSKIKALSRRLAELGEDEYDGMRPVAEMSKYIRESLYAFISKPYDWTQKAESDEMKEQAISQIAGVLSSKLDEFASTRLWKSQMVEWVKAYQRKDIGSARLRASDLKRINTTAMVIPGESDTKASEANELISAVCKIVQEAVYEADGELKSFLPIDNVTSA